MPLGHLPLWSVSWVRLLSPRLASNLSHDEQPSYRSVGGLPGPRQHPFGLGITLSSRLWLPRAFRPLAFASWLILCPLETSATLTSSLLTWIRLHGGSHVPHYRDATGGDAFYTPKSWCPRLGACVNPWPLQTTRVGQSADSPLPSCSVIVSGNCNSRSLTEDSLRIMRQNLIAAE
jgi:hypothetical protein